jgi:hypothetical protein
MYREGEEINDFYFMTKGVAAFIKEQQHCAIIGLIDPNQIL